MDIEVIYLLRSAKFARVINVQELVSFTLCRVLKYKLIIGILK